MTESEAIECLQNRVTCCLKEPRKLAIKALEKQIEMKRYCDENGCADCPYHNTSRNDNRCMNDFIIEME